MRKFNLIVFPRQHIAIDYLSRLALGGMVVNRAATEVRCPQSGDIEQVRVVSSDGELRRLRGIRYDIIRCDPSCDDYWTVSFSKRVYSELTVLVRG